MLLKQPEMLNECFTVEAAFHVMTTTYIKLKRMEIKRYVEDKSTRYFLTVCTFALMSYALLSYLAV
jgi:hypothetical protein